MGIVVSGETGSAPLLFRVFVEGFRFIRRALFTVNARELFPCISSVSKIFTARFQKIKGFDCEALP